MHNKALFNQKIGPKLSGIGNLSRMLAVQTFTAHKFQITPEQFMVLEVLYENNELYQRQLSALTLKDRPNISRIITILEGHGFVTKTPDVNGRKIFKIKITEDGINIYKEILPVITQIWTDLLSNISEEELLMCEKVLSKIKQNLVANVNIQM